MALRKWFSNARDRHGNRQTRTTKKPAGDNTGQHEDAVNDDLGAAWSQFHD